MINLVNIYLKNFSGY